MKKYCAEFIGTAVLVTFGCGVAATTGFGTGYVGIALAFGLVIVAMAYSIGNISGCHVNPAVSLGVLLSGKMSMKDFAGYVIAQSAGAVAGALILLAVLGTHFGFGTNAIGNNVPLNAWQALLVETVLTFVFVFAVIGVTSKESFGSAAGIVIGLTLTLVHLLGLPLTGTSVNPARSFGPALIAALTGNTTPIAQVWVFIAAPLAGAALSALCYKALAGGKK